MENFNEDGPEQGTPVRHRNKKKGTLAKLREKKQKELGSNTSLPVDSKIDLTPQENDVKTTEHTGTHNASVNKPDFYKFSTKDKVTKDETTSEKPTPRPRVSRRPSEIAAEGKDGSEKLYNDKEKVILLDDLGDTLDVKLNGDHKTDSTLQGTTFIPKPPSTPRTPKSTPRTPRGYLPFGKNDKRSQDSGSSETEEKPLSDSSAPADLLNNSSQLEISPSSQKLTRQAPVLVRPSEGLLKRRGSKVSLPEVYSEEAAKDTKNFKSLPSNSKSPLNKSLTNMNNENLKSSQSSPVILNDKPESSISTTPQDKYLKSSKKSSLFKKDAEQARADNQNLSQLSLKNLDNNESSTNPPGKQGVKAKHGDENKILPSNFKLAPSPPSSVRLEPINPINKPPPLTEEFSSKTLRTSYKIDSNVKTGDTSADKGTNKSDSVADKLSQKSFTSTSVLPLITTKEARSRRNKYPETTIGTRSNPYLGSEELSRYFPDKKVNVFVGTWNMNELKEVKVSLDDFILPENCDYVQDIYAVGTQENDMNKKEWELSLQELLGPSHVLYHSVSHGSLHLVIFIRRDLIWFCSNPEDDVISLRALTMVKTKGAIGISMRLFGTSYLFINCHLTSDRDNDISRKKLRLENYFKVIREMRLPKSTPNSPSFKKTGDVTTAFDCVFWFGDLNFRIERERQAVVGKVVEITSEEFPNFETLLGGDQLLKYMSEDKIFGGFQEGRINFYPTFKFDLNNDTYDSSTKSRVPSYTDRVVFRCKKKNDIHCLQYDAVMSIKVSDHRPVYGQFETNVKPGDDGTVYSPGHFDRNIYMEALRRRVTKRSEEKKQSAICSLQ